MIFNVDIMPVNILVIELRSSNELFNVIFKSWKSRKYPDGIALIIVDVVNWFAIIIDVLLLINSKVSGFFF